MTTPNKSLLKRTLAHIQSHPQQWEQQQWITPASERDDPSQGVAYDFGAWAVVLSGYTVDAEGLVSIDQLPADVIHRLDGRDDVWQTDDGSNVTSAGRVAEVLLDIPAFGFGGDGCHLFCGHNDLNDLERFVAELCGDTVETAAES